jgi:hypothetical protein
LNYEDPQAVANSGHRYCTGWPATGCFRKIELTGMLRAAHLDYDAAANAIWIGGWWTPALGRYDISNDAFTMFPASEPSNPEAPAPFGLLKSGVWHTGADQNYVYFTEFFDNDLVRFDKTADPATCQDLDADGHNPCMDEIHLPASDRGAAVYDLQFYDGRLWFAGGGGARDAALGYVDLSSWNTGVVYTGMEALVDANRANLGPLVSGGLDINSSGVIAMNDGIRKQLLRLTPR